MVKTGGFNILFLNKPFHSNYFFLEDTQDEHDTVETNLELSRYMIKHAYKNLNDSLNETNFVPTPAPTEIKVIQGVLVKGKPGQPEVCIDFTNQPPPVSTGCQIAINMIRDNPGSLTSDFEDFSYRYYLFA